MQRSFLIALVIALAATAWMLSPYLESYLWPSSADDDAGISADPSAGSDGPSGKLLRVSVRHSVAETKVKSLALTGQTEPSRRATLKAETAGRIVAVEADKGASVKEGDVIARLAMNDRQSRLDEARALVKQRQIEYDAAQSLSSKGFQTQIRLAETRSLLEAAQAQLRRIELDIEYTAVRAPFDGVLQDRVAELGDYVGIGDPVAVVVDLDPVLAVAQLSEREAAAVRRNNDGRARLVTGEVVDGRVRYVSVVGSAGTRTFRVELELENAGNRIPAGLTAEISLPIESVAAHRLSPAALTLNDAGIVGVKTVDENDIVRFHAAELVGAGPDGVWIGGLPHQVTIITIGQEFVLPGQAVIPVPESLTGAPPAAAAGGPS